MKKFEKGQIIPNVLYSDFSKASDGLLLALTIIICFQVYFKVLCLVLLPQQTNNSYMSTNISEIV